MTSPTLPLTSTRRTSGTTLPASAMAAMVAGWWGAAAAWAITSQWTDLSTVLSSYTRLDQGVALTFGGGVGAAVLALRARHRRDPVAVAGLAGLLLGGMGALVGASLGIVLPLGNTPAAFVAQRVITWALLAGSAAAALAAYTRVPKRAVVAESAVLGAVSGVLAGALYSLPGPGEMWLPVAMTVGGAGIGFATVSTGLARAAAVVQRLPPRDRRHTLWSLHECALDADTAVVMGDVEVACTDGIVWVHPPPAGGILDGLPLYRAMPLTASGVYSVGRTRVRVQLPERGRAPWLIRP